MSTVTCRSDKTHVIAECKRLRRTGGCMRECDCWHPNWRGSYPPFCKSAEQVGRHRKRR